MATKGELYTALAMQNLAYRGSLVNNIELRKQALADAQSEFSANAKKMSADEMEKEIIRLRADNRRWQEVLAERDAMLRNWIVSQKAYKELFMELAKENGLSEEEREKQYTQKVLSVGEQHEDLKDSGEYQKAKGLPMKS